MYAPIRDGNRGGRGLFSWEDVRVMSYKDRECYLGSTVNLGFLDKGGRWRKRDWWTKKTDLNNNLSPEEELKRVKEEDQRNIEEALGIRKPKKAEVTGLTEGEIKELTKKGGEEYDPEAQGLKVAGLGFVKQAETAVSKPSKHHSEHHSKHRSHKKHRPKQYRD